MDASPASLLNAYLAACGVTLPGDTITEGTLAAARAGDPAGQKALKAAMDRETDAVLASLPPIIGPISGMVQATNNTLKATVEMIITAVQRDEGWKVCIIGDHLARQQQVLAAKNLARTIRAPTSVYIPEGFTGADIYGSSMLIGASSIRGMDLKTFVPILFNLVEMHIADRLVNDITTEMTWSADAYGSSGDNYLRHQDEQARQIYLAYCEDAAIARGLDALFVPVRFSGTELPELLTRVDVQLFEKLMALPEAALLM